MAVNNLAACLAVTLAYEGGLSLSRADPGNWTGGAVGVGSLKGTKYGIAAGAHPTLDIAHLTIEDARAIYGRDYWGPAGCEALPAGLDLSHFDATVNSGRGRSARWLAKAQHGGGVDPADPIHAYAAARLASLHAFRSWATFGKGWAARVAGVEAKALTMALGAAAGPAAAAAGGRAAARARLVGAASTASAMVGAGATAIAAAPLVHALPGPAHPILAGTITFLSFACWLGTSFHAAQSGARAAVLSHAAAGR